MNEYTAILSDFMNKYLIWIRITDNFTMTHHRSQQLDFNPCALYIDRGDQMVSDVVFHSIHRYTGDGVPLSVITLSDDVEPCWMTRHGDSDQHLITDSDNQQVLVIDGQEHVNRRYKDEIHGVKLGNPWEITTDRQGRVLIVDHTAPCTTDVQEERRGKTTAPWKSVGTIMCMYG